MRGQAEGDPSQSLFSPVMHSPVGDEHGEAEAWTCSSWDPSRSKAGGKRGRALERSLQCMFKMPIQGTGTATHIVLLGQCEGRPQMGLDKARKGS